MRPNRLPLAGLGAGAVLVAAAVVLPAATGWDVHVNHVPPLHADWRPRVGPGTLPAVLIAGVAGVGAVSLAERARWRWLLTGCFAAGLAWLLALAYIDGRAGVATILDTPYEYLRTARRLTDFSAALPGWTDRITYAALPHNWPVHVAGHPPGATYFFTVLVGLGLGSGFAAGLVVTVIAATTPVAVLSTVRTLGAEQLARRAAPFLTFGPAAIWSSVSADAVFAAVAAWGIAALAAAAVAPRWPVRVTLSLVAGGLLGFLVMLSYGMPLMGLLALVVLVLAKAWRPLPLAVVAALAVVGAFAVQGFSYLDALSALHTRYWEGVASRRPAAYWMWANLAALVISAGPMLGAGLAGVLARPVGMLRDSRTRVVAALAMSGTAMVLAADLSQMSRAEVERIWLPFEPWMLLSCALLPERWRRWGLALQLGTALVVQHLLATGW